MKSDHQTHHSRLAAKSPEEIPSPKDTESKAILEQEMENFQIKLKILREYLAGNSDPKLDSTIINHVSDPLEKNRSDSKTES